MKQPKPPRTRKPTVEWKNTSQLPTIELPQSLTPLPKPLPNKSAYYALQAGDEVAMKEDVGEVKVKLNPVRPVPSVGEYHGPEEETVVLAGGSLKALGHAYAKVLRVRAKVLRTGLTVEARTRKLMSEDLEALAWLAENMPDVFTNIPR